jgi:hypothetical protein
LIERNKGAKKNESEEQERRQQRRKELEFQDGPSEGERFPLISFIPSLKIPSYSTLPLWRGHIHLRVKMGSLIKEQKNKGKEKRRKEKSNRRKREHMNIPKENINDISADFFALLILSSILFMYLP